MRKSLIAACLAIASLVCANGAFAQANTQAGSAVDKAMANIPIEKIIGQLLGSIDFNALSAGMEQAAKDVSEGKQPQLADSPALQDMQAKLQKQIGIVGPDLMKTMLAVMTPLLAEMKNEIAKDFNLPGATVGEPSQNLR
jgi:hypothetical protein